MSRNRELSPERRELLGALNSAPGPLSPAALARFLGRDREATKRLLYKCRDDNQVVVVDGGYTTAFPYQHVSFAMEDQGEFVHDKRIKIQSSPHSGTGATDQSPDVQGDTGTEEAPDTVNGAKTGTSSEDVGEMPGVPPVGVSAESAKTSVSESATTTTEGGVNGVDKPDLIRDMGMYCREPPNG